MGNTQAEMGIEFNRTASPAEIPKATEVAQTLVDAVSNPNSTFNISIVASSVQLEPFYRNEFSSFRFLRVISFSNGSIINNVDLGFASTSVPNNTQIANVLIRAASNITAFNIDTTSISVDGTLTGASSGVSHKISLITAFCLALLSWRLSSQQ
ncbi:hypothetical protein PAMA_013917 [Pampus argenteus]